MAAITQLAGVTSPAVTPSSGVLPDDARVQLIPCGFGISQRSVIHRLLCLLATAEQEVLQSADCSEASCQELLAALLKLHSSAAAGLSAAPRHFMTLLQQYSTVLESKRSQLLQQQQFLKVLCMAGVGFMYM